MFRDGVERGSRCGLPPRFFDKMIGENVLKVCACDLERRTMSASQPLAAGIKPCSFLSSGFH
jgi:hypothetical protein